jgi:RNA polymerase sigma factor (sigma-70 family)
MLGHPADAEDAAQEILIVVLTHLGSFRGESAFRTWVWRIATNHLGRVRRGRRETVTFELLDERLHSGLRDEVPDPSDPESELLAAELRLRCTQAMLLCLDRDLRVAYLLGDVFELSSAEAADVLQIDPAAYRKRLSRARLRLHDFVRSWCGVYAADNPCRCGGQVPCAIERQLLDPRDLYLSRHRGAPPPAAAARETTGLLRVAEMMREHPAYLAPESMVKNLRELLTRLKEEQP